MGAMFAPCIAGGYTNRCSLRSRRDHRRRPSPPADARYRAPRVDGFHPRSVRGSGAASPKGRRHRSATAGRASPRGDDTLDRRADRFGQDARRVPRCASTASTSRTKRASRSTGIARVVYVSPLKALAVDIAENLERPLREIAAVAAELGSRRARHRGRGPHRRHAERASGRAWCARRRASSSRRRSRCTSWSRARADALRCAPSRR